MTSSARLPALPLALLLLAGGGCELFTGLEPCTPGSDECFGAEVCAEDGFCRPGDGGAADGGAPDAGAD